MDGDFFFSLGGGRVFHVRRVKKTYQKDFGKRTMRGDIT